MSQTCRQPKALSKSKAKWIVPPFQTQKLLERFLAIQTVKVVPVIGLDPGVFTLIPHSQKRGVVEADATLLHFLAAILASSFFFFKKRTCQDGAPGAADKHGMSLQASCNARDVSSEIERFRTLTSECTGAP